MLSPSPPVSKAGYGWPWVDTVETTAICFRRHLFALILGSNVSRFFELWWFLTPHLDSTGDPVLLTVASLFQILFLHVFRIALHPQKQWLYNSKINQDKLRASLISKQFCHSVGSLLESNRFLDRRIICCDLGADLVQKRNPGEILIASAPFRHHLASYVESKTHPRRNLVI